MRRQKERGYSLVELVIVISILAVTAAIAIPKIDTNSENSLELAAAEYAAAIRMARSESIRLGQPHGFYENSSGKFIDVFRLNTATTPATLVYDVYHPIDKSLYHFDIDLHSLAAAETLSPVVSFASACNQNDRIYFDGNGTPWCTDPISSRLNKYELHMYNGNAYKLITIDGITGRVTIQ